MDGREPCLLLGAGEIEEVEKAALKTKKPSGLGKAFCRARLLLRSRNRHETNFYNRPQSLTALVGAQERTRTSTALPPLGPEPSASTNSATWAGCVCSKERNYSRA